jgi:hypothetical protein
MSISLVLLCGCVDTPPAETTTTVKETTSTAAVASTTTSTVKPSTTTLTQVITTTSSTTLRKVVLKQSILNNCFGFLAGDADEIRTIRRVGAGWVRPHPGPFAWEWLEPSDDSFNFAEADRWVRLAQENEVAILGTIWPFAGWDQSGCHGGECVVSSVDQFYPREKFGALAGIPKSRCIPCDMDAYKSFITVLVERYDGDGVDDMPGLRQPVWYWEVLNEPSMQGGDLTFFRGEPSEYVQLLEATYSAVKAACPECVVVQGGAAGSHQEALDYWGEVFRLGGGGYFDVANIHFISHGDRGTLNVKPYRELMTRHGVRKPIWVTEAQYPSESDVLASVDGAQAAGAEKIFHTTFKIGRRGPPKPGEYSKVYEDLRGKCRT